MELNEEKIIEFLENHVGEYATSYRLVKAIDAYEGDDLDKENLFELENQLRKIAGRNGFELNKDHNEGKEIGLPWNIDFVIRKRDEEKIANEILSEELMMLRLYKIEQEYGIFDEDEELIGFKKNMPWKVKKVYDIDTKNVEDSKKKGILLD